MPLPTRFRSNSSARLDRRRATGASLALMLVCGVLFGCGPGNVSKARKQAVRERGQAVAMDLLGRRPDVLFETKGVVTPKAENIAGDAFGGGSGWQLDARRHAQPVYFTQSASVDFDLPVVEVVDRMLELWLIAPGEVGDAVSRPVEVTLNGRLAATLEVTPQLGKYEVDAPEALWQEGPNVLELAVQRLEDAAEGSEIFKRVGVGVSRIAYGDERTVRAKKYGQLQFEPDTGVSYLIEPLAGGVLELTGRSKGAGSFLVRFGRLDPSDGSAEIEAYGVEEILVDPGEPFEALLPLPDVEDDSVLSVQVRWYPDGERSARIESALVVTEESIERPSILFLSLDTLSARHLSTYGYARETSPNLDALGEEGIVFERTLANAPWTTLSYISQFSGLFPGASLFDAQGKGASIWDRMSLAPSRWTLAESMRAAGYETAAWVDNPWLKPSLGIDQGFDLFDRSASEVALWDPTGGIDMVSDAFVEWLDQRDDSRPFFALVQALDVHAPYVVDEDHSALFEDDGLYRDAGDEVIGVKQVQSFGVIPEHVARGEDRNGELPERMPLRTLVNAYDRKIRHVDETVGKLFEALRERGLYDDLLIVVSSDHGESLTTHQFYFAHATLFDETLHVPLIFKLPGGANAGTRVPTATQNVDIYPTLSEVAGVPVREFLRGRSLLGAMAGDELEPFPIWSEGGLGQQYAVEFDGKKLLYTDHRRTTPQTRLRHRRLPDGWLERTAPELVGTMWRNSQYYEYLRENEEFRDRLDALMGPRFEIFDLDEDPGEVQDLYELENPDFERLLAVAKLVLEANEEDRGRASRVTSRVVMSPEQRRQLIELGYLEDTE